MKRFQDYSVSNKVIGAFALVLAATLALGVFANLRVHQVDTKAQELGHRWLPDTLQLAQLQYNATRLRSWQGAVLLSTSAKQRQTALTKLESLRSKTAQLVKEFDESCEGDTEKAIGTQVREAWAAYEPLMQTEMSIEKSDGPSAAFDYYMTTMMAGFETLRSSIDAALAYHKTGGEVATADSDATAKASQWMIYGALALASLLALWAGWLLIRGVSAPLKSITGAMEDLAAGKLDAHVPHADQEDEIGKLAGAMTAFKNQLAEAERSKTVQTETIVASIGTGLDHLAKGDLTHRIEAELTGPFVKLKGDFNAAMARLQGMVNDVLGATAQITTGAREISQAADDLSRRTEQQAASLEETSAALEEITATVKKTATNTKEVNVSMASAKNAAEEGGRVVETATKAMDAIAQSSKQITDIIGVIDEIAFQTNLLALNAGVEAARAGDAGRGFAVVASEVRALAQRSSEAAKEIKTLINASGDQVSDGVRHVAATGQALTHIVQQVQQINTVVQEMALAAQQESTGIEEVNAAVGQMDRVTQQNAAMVEQSTAASRNLAAETQHLQELMAFFEVGHSAAPVVRPAPKPAARPVAAARPVVRSSARSGSAVRSAAAPAAAPVAAEDSWEEF